jgi:hypothetical protein
LRSLACAAQRPDLEFSHMFFVRLYDESGKAKESGTVFCHGSLT